MKHILTDEATKLLELESKMLGEELREASINEALRSRGEPIEVTASDVRKARELFQKREITLKPTTDLLLKTYIVFGLAIFVGGMGYPAIREMMDRTGMASVTTTMLAVSGLVISAGAYFMRQYLDAMLRSRSRRSADRGETKGSQQEG